MALNKANGGIAYRFHARDLHLVMGPAAPGTSIRFRVLIDGKPPGAAHGIDVDEQGNGTVTEQRLYQLIRQPKPITDRQFEIEFLDPGVEALRSRSAERTGPDRKASELRMPRRMLQTSYDRFAPEPDPRDSCRLIPRGHRASSCLPGFKKLS